MFIVPDFAKYYFLTLWSRKDVDARITNKNRYHLNRKELSHARATKMAKVWKTGPARLQLVWNTLMSLSIINWDDLKITGNNM